MEHKQQTINAYNKIAKSFSDTHPDTIYSAEFAKFKTLLNGKKVLEIGCGTGRDAELFVNAGLDYTGVDLRGYDRASSQACTKC